MNELSSRCTTSSTSFFLSFFWLYNFSPPRSSSSANTEYGYIQYQYYPTTTPDRTQRKSCCAAAPPTPHSLSTRSLSIKSFIVSSSLNFFFFFSLLISSILDLFASQDAFSLRVDPRPVDQTTSPLPPQRHLTIPWSRYPFSSQVRQRLSDA